MSSLIHDLSTLILASTPELAEHNPTHSRYHAAGRLAAHILDHISNHIDLSLPIPAPPTDQVADTHAGTHAGTHVVDSIPLPHNLTPDLNIDLSRLCAAAGLTYHDVAFRENQPVIVATDPDGVREYYTLAALQDAAAAGAETALAVVGTQHLNTRFGPARRRSGRAGILSPSRGRVSDDPATAMAARPRRAVPDHRPVRPPGA